MSTLADRSERDAAVIDIGSNSIRLVIYRLDGRAIWTVFNEKVLAGLGREVAQTGRLSLGPVVAAAGAFALSTAQRRLSTPARMIRRRTDHVEGQITLANGDVLPVDARTLLAPLETALHAMSWAVVLLAAALAIAKLH